MRRYLSMFVLMGLVSAGCGDLGSNRRNASGAAGGAGLVAPEQQILQPPAAVPAGMPQTPAATPQAPAASAISAAAQLGQGANTQAAGTAPQQAPAAAPANAGASPATGQPNLVREKAQAGVSGKGNYEPGVVTTPISAYFQARERIIFEIQIPAAMKLYEADKGFKPKTQEDFMRDIVQANLIKLPELPPGHKYVYDPQKGELMIEHPQ